MPSTMHLRNAEIPLLHMEKYVFQEILWTLPQNATRIQPFSRSLYFASNEIWLVEIGPAVRTRSVFLSWKISRFHILTEIAWGNFQNIFQLWGPITPKPHNRMYQLNVSWNSIHSSVSLQKISSIAWYLRPVMRWTTHTYVQEEEKQNKQDWILQAKQYISTDIWIWPLRVIRGQKYFHHSKAHTWLPI